MRTFMRRRQILDIFETAIELVDLRDFKVEGWSGGRRGWDRPIRDQQGAVTAGRARAPLMSPLFTLRQQDRCRRGGVYLFLTIVAHDGRALLAAGHIVT